MSTQLSNTLFHFSTIRTPELVSKDSKEKFFIEHPDGTSGPFYDAVEAMPPGGDKRVVMETVANTFINLSEDAVIAINPNLHEFGINLLSKRQSITYEEINLEVPTLSNLDILTKLTLWDNLFFQTIKNDSPYIREAIIYLLVADYFIEQFAANPISSDEQVRNFADSKVVMPSILFSIDEEYHTVTNMSNLPATALVKKHITQAEAYLKAEMAKQALIELSILEREYFKNQKLDEKTYVQTYNANLKTAVLSAPKAQIVDEISGFTFDQFETPFTQEPYTYEPDPQINLPTIESNLSDVSFYILNENDLLTGDSYAQINTETSEFIKEQLAISFINTPFVTESVDVNGTAIPTCSLENRNNQKFNYHIKFIKKTADKYGIFLSVDVKDPCLKLQSAEITIGNAPGITQTKFSAKNMNGVITIDMTPNGYVNISGSPSTLSTEGEIVGDNGLILSWSQVVNVEEGTSGIMTEGQNYQGNTKLFIPSGYGLTRLGIADYKRVEQNLCCYKPGEVSHIENILAREYKERSTRRLRRSEESTNSSLEMESESLTDSSSTNRFDMQKEISSLLRSNREFGMTGNFHVGASYGIPKSGEIEASIDLGANFATSSSKEQTDRQVTTFAKDVTQKALERVVNKIKEERTTKIIEEFEEQNKHGFDNRQGAQHISGVYRWIDAEYKNKIYNYGKRLHYEFMIPEPSAFHLIAKAAGVSSGNDLPLVLPLDPRKDQFGSVQCLKSASVLDEHNYMFWAATYNAEVIPPPTKIQLVGKTYKQPDDGKPWYEGTKSVTDQIVIPEGYGLHKATVAAMGETVVAVEPQKCWSRYYIAIGDNTREYWCGNLVKQTFLEDNEITELENFSDSVPVGVQFIGINGGIVTISLELIRKAELLATWQLQTYNIIINAYQDRLQEYKDALAELEVKKSGKMADNPSYYREIEQTVLKKNCMAYLVGHTNMGKSFTTGDEMKNFHVKITKQMDEYAASIKFFEQAFEWNIMSYRFYPFFWADSNKWVKLYGYQNDDQTFKAFLQSGMARVFVTVRPGFEKSVMYYMKTGQIWNGGEVPIIGDKLYMSILDELKNQEFYLDGFWKTRIPTTLNILQKDSVGLDSEGLPCWCNSENGPDEEFDHVDPFTGLEVFINGNS